MNTGKIEIVFGPMFSGKSSYVIHESEIFASIGLNVLIINNSIDIRSDKELSTHSNFTVLDKKSKNISMIKVKFLSDLNVEYIKTFDVIVIDEAQFFSDLFDFTIKLFNMGKQVLISSLDGTFDRKPFGKVFDLIPYSTKVTKLCAKCKRCYEGFHKIEDAPFSKRITESIEQIEIGGEDKYIPVCGYHFSI